MQVAGEAQIVIRKGLHTGGEGLVLDEIKEIIGLHKQALLIHPEHLALAGVAFILEQFEVRLALRANSQTGTNKTVQDQVRTVLFNTNVARGQFVFFRTHLTFGIVSDQTVDVLGIGGVDLRG